VKRFLRLLRLLLGHPKVRRIASENVEDLEYHDKTGELTWKSRYELFEADLDGGYSIDVVEVSFRYSFSSKKADVVHLEIDNVKPKKKVIGLGANEKTKKALVGRLESAMRKIFKEVLRKGVR